MKGKELRAIRDKLDWTQVQMAMALEVTPNTVARWERDADEKVQRLAVAERPLTFALALARAGRLAGGRRDASHREGCPCPRDRCVRGRRLEASSVRCVPRWRTQR